MKLTHLELSNFLAHHHLSIPFAPMTVIAGPNRSGKSSIADGFAFAILAELRRVEAKGERDKLVTDGMDKGHVMLKVGDVAVQRDVASGKLQVSGALPMPETAIKAAMPYLLDARRFGRATPDERRDLLFEVMRVAVTREAIIQLLAARKHPEAILASIKSVPGRIPEWIAHGQKMTTEARGAWKATTGETYGAVKAETWAAPVPEQPHPDELEAAKQRAEWLPTEIGDLQRWLGRIDEAANHESRLAGLRAKADQVPALTTALDEAKAAATEAAAGVETLQGMLDDIEERIPSDAPHCPQCGAAVHVRDGQLHKYEKPARPATKDERATAYAALENSRTALRQAEAKRDAAERDLQDAERTATTLAQLTGAEHAPDTSAPRESVERDLKAAQAELAQLTAKLAAWKEAEQAAARAKAKTEKGARAHQDVKAWSALVAALTDDVPNELLSKALGPINETLRSFAVGSKWPQLWICKDLTITAGGRPYGLLSESEQWRADTMLTIAIAHHSELRFAILDRFDLLDVPSRRPALAWLYNMVKDGTAGRLLDSVVVLGTLKEPPKVPAAVAVHWLGEPIVTATTEPAAEAA